MYMQVKWYVHNAHVYLCPDSRQQLKCVLNPYQKGGPGVNSETESFVHVVYYMHVHVHTSVHERRNQGKAKTLELPCV